MKKKRFAKICSVLLKTLHFEILILYKINENIRGRTPDLVFVFLIHVPTHTSKVFLKLIETNLDYLNNIS